jgi:hypothetical protein
MNRAGYPETKVKENGDTNKVDNHNVLGSRQAGTQKQKNFLEF